MPHGQGAKHCWKNDKAGKGTDDGIFTFREHEEDAGLCDGTPMIGDSCTDNHRSHVYAYTPDGSWVCTSCGLSWAKSAPGKDFDAYVNEAISLTAGEGT